MTGNDGRRLIVGIDAAPPVPMQCGNPETCEFRGFEVDLLTELGTRLGTGIVYRRARWSAIVEELIAGHLDLLCSAVTASPERSRTMDFCDPHLVVNLAAVMRVGASSELRLPTRRIGLRSGTIAETWARAHGAEHVTLSESNEELYAALSSGAVDLVVDDSPIAEYFARAVVGLGTPLMIPNTRSVYAIALRKGRQELRTVINAALHDMRAVGMLAAMRSRWNLGSEGQ